jgi:hypothetical protein
MSKAKKAIIFIVLLTASTVIFLLIDRAKIVNENKSLKIERGERIQGNLFHALDVVQYAKKDLSNNNSSMLNRYCWQFNELTMSDLPNNITFSALSIRNHYNEIIRLSESNLSQAEINSIKDRLGLELSKLEQVIVLINKDCGIDNMKFYLLNSIGNETMKKTTNILLEVYSSFN